MSLPMFKNYLGIKLSNEEMQHIPNPKVELTTHVTIKTIQFSSVVGFTLVAPIVNTLTGPRTLPGYFRRMIQYGTRGMLIGIPLGPALTFMKIRNDSEERNFDRCYRLRHNKTQIALDRFTAVGGTTGLLFSRIIGVTALQGLSLGIVTGLISGIVYMHS